MYSIWFTGYFNCLIDLWIPWNSLKIHGIINAVVSMELHGAFPWNSMENVLILHGNWCPNVFHGNLWRNFHGIPWKLMSYSLEEFLGEFSMEIHGIPGEVFHTGNHRTKHIHFQIKIVKNAHHDLDHITIKIPGFWAILLKSVKRLNPGVISKVGLVWLFGWM